MFDGSFVAVMAVVAVAEVEIDIVVVDDDNDVHILLLSFLSSSHLLKLALLSLLWVQFFFTATVY